MKRRLAVLLVLAAIATACCTRGSSRIDYIVIAGDDDQ